MTIELQRVIAAVGRSYSLCNGLPTFAIAQPACYYDYKNPEVKAGIKMQSVRLALCAALLLCAPFVAYSAEWSAPTRIESVYVLDELDVIRLHVLVSNPVSNPANCLHPDFVDIRLDAEGRTPTQQREMLNLINLAFVTRRSVRLRFLSESDPEPCSTAGTTSSIRVATGVQAIY